MKKILLIDPDKTTRSALQVLLASEACVVSIAYTAKEGQKLLKNELYHLLIIDQEVIDSKQFDPISWLQRESPETRIIVLNESPSVKSGNVIAAVSRPLDVNEVVMYANIALDNGATEITKDISLDKYIQNCCANVLAKSVLVSNKGKSGLILFRLGKVYYASQDNLRGEAAFYRMLSWKHCELKEITVNNLPSPNIHREYSQLMMDSAMESTGSTGSISEEITEPSATKVTERAKVGGSNQTKSKRRTGAFVALLLLAAVAGGGYLLQKNFSVEAVALRNTEQLPLPAANIEQSGTAKPPPQTSDVQATAVENLKRETILRLHGSNTVGAELAPALVEAYLRQKLGAKKVITLPGEKENERSLMATFDDHVKVVEIQAHGSSTAFQDMIADKCDLGMASRKIKEKEVKALINKGVMTSVSNEHIIALDGIAVIVHKSNQLESLTMEQLTGIFSGSISNWSVLGGSQGPIHVYARDDNSGTYDTFQSIVLGKDYSLTTAAKRFESNPELSATVAQDPGAIGFTSLATIGTAKALSIAETGAEAIFPSFFTVATEDYPLARRLYLYSESQSNNPNVLDFLEFVNSYNGQEVVKEVGLVDMNINSLYVRQPDLGRTINPKRIEPYIEAIDNSQRLSLNFRFNSGTTQLDNRSLRDLDRVVDYLKKNLDRQILLAGFADNAGEYEHNMVLAMNRAEAVYEQLHSRGITARKVLSCGEELPVATNAKESGRHKNRRVEVWLK